MCYTAYPKPIKAYMVVILKTSTLAEVLGAFELRGYVGELPFELPSLLLSGPVFL